MDALVMCGGRGTRLDDPTEKPLFEIEDQPMLDRVLEAIQDSAVESVYAAISPHVPMTRAYLDEQSVTQIETPGAGYVRDLDYALDEVDAPVLTVATDLPLLDAAAIDCVLDLHEQGSLTVCVPVAMKRVLGLSADLSFEHDGRQLAPVGINVVSESNQETVHVTYDIRFAINVNRTSDAHIAERLA